jgi:hypothetical protein
MAVQSNEDCRLLNEFLLISTAFGFYLQSLILNILLYF